MKRLSDHDAPRNWGPQTTAIPVGGGLGILGAVALLFGVAYEVPEVQMWALLAMPASLIISAAYLLWRRSTSRPPTTLFGAPESLEPSESQHNQPLKHDPPFRLAAP
jgi:hypothetical protein